MRKEILFAILAGITFGLIIAFGVWRANIALRPEGANTTEDGNRFRNSSSRFWNNNCQARNYQVITSSPTVLTGITKPNVLLVTSTENEDYVVKTNGDGEFEVEIDVVGGINEVILTAFDTDGTETEERLTLIYSSELTKQEEEEN